MLFVLAYELVEGNIFTPSHQHPTHFPRIPVVVRHYPLIDTSSLSFFLSVHGNEIIPELLSVAGGPVLFVVSCRSQGNNYSAETE